MRNEPKYYLKTLGDAFRILNVIGQSHEPRGIAELSDETGMGRSKTHRILDNLRYWGVVEQDPKNRKYLLGNRLIALAMNKLKTVDLIKLASPVLADIVEKCEETVHLAVLEEGQVLYLDKREGPQAVGIISKVGQRLPAHCTGLGKVLLAFSEEDLVDRIIDHIGLKRFTKHTITEKNILKKELANIRMRGYALDREEIEEGLCCIAAPVRNYTGEVVAAISVSIPAFRFTDEKQVHLTEQITLSALKISKKFGSGAE
jgi:IclR family KDG regulon transcriptional repressor